MSGKTSTQSKNKYNAKAYDQLPVRVKKGKKAVYQEAAEKQGESLNAYIVKAIEDRMTRENEITK